MGGGSKAQRALDFKKWGLKPRSLTEVYAYVWWKIARLKDVTAMGKHGKCCAEIILAVENDHFISRTVQTTTCY